MPDTVAPNNVAREEITDPFRCWIYRPKKIKGAYFIAPGLHFAGPSDHRMDRFCRILANAGFLVFAPFLPSFCALQVREEVIDELSQAFEAFMGMQDREPVLFSISFGSLPAFRLAAKEKRIKRLIVFGGFADFASAARFALGEGDHSGPRDPLNAPAVYLNLFDGAPELMEAWRTFTHKTWSSEEMKSEDMYVPIARQIAESLPDEHRLMFLQGCGVEPGGYDAIKDALERDRPFLDPRPHLQSIACPVHLVHGSDDDVIPISQLELLQRALPTAYTYRTGLYGHSRASPLTNVQAGLREAKTMLGILRTLART